MSSTEPQSFKVVVIGDGGVGKSGNSSLILSYFTT